MLKRNFIKGRMNLDVDERMLPPGEYRRAENIDVINSEDSDAGVVKNMLSHKRLTYFDIGSNPKDLGKFEDNKNNKFYWWTLSDNGCFLFEWDDVNQSQSIVLADTRPVGQRGLDLKEGYLITGVGKIYSQDGKNDLLLWTDDNMEPCCINIERAKTWGENNFEKEDVYLIKKPPSFSPKTRGILDGTESNYIEDKPFAFAFRYKFLDGEYSALSNFSLYNFSPKGFNINYFTAENEGMVNAFNAVNIEFDTGDHRVTEIQVIAKQSNSNNLFIVETFNKESLGWGDNQPQNFNFYNNKLYTLLPEKELYRLFDNVPRKAKALTITNNIPVFGNYLEGYDIVDEAGKKIIIDFFTTYNSYSNEADYIFESDIENSGGVSDFQVTPSNQNVFVEGKTLYLSILFSINGIPEYNGDFQLQLTSDYVNFSALFASDEFQTLLQAINNDIANNYTYTPDQNMIVVSDPYITVSFSSGEAHFVLHPVIVDVSEGTPDPQPVTTTWDVETEISIGETGLGLSCHTNRSYEVGLVYKDEFKRSSTVIIDHQNSVYIPQRESINYNKLQATINHPAPEWAKYVSLAVKVKPLRYQTVIVNVFYQEGDYVWALLLGDNKDKVKEGDYLIPKTGPEPISKVNKIKVLEIKTQEKDFIAGNVDADGNDIEEVSGTYMKIRPQGISMSSQDAETTQDSWNSQAGNDHIPVGYLDLGTTIDQSGTTEIPVSSGSYIEINYHNSRKLSDGWINWRGSKKIYATRDYDTVEEWFEENIINKQFIITRDENGSTDDIKDNIELVRGELVTTAYGYTQFVSNPSGKLFLKITGNVTGSGGNNKSNLRIDFLLRQGAGLFIFETAPVQADEEIFYETSQEFEIENGNHKGNIQDQNYPNTPSVIELDFFNCYSFGNGIESYRVRDALNVNFLNIDTRPNATSVEEYKAVRRFADWTYGEAYVESAGINGINVFNLSTGNFKEGDKQYGSIQKLFTRYTDIVSLQEYKAFRLLFGKDLISTAEGIPVISATPEILGKTIEFAGDNGIGLHPESFANDAYRIYYFCPHSASPIRLSMDGTSEINYGLKDFFRDLTIESNGSKKIGGFDPYKNLYVLTSETPLVPRYAVECGNVIYKKITEDFIYDFNLNGLNGDIILSYEVISGNVDIVVDHDNTLTQESSLTGVGNISIPRDNLSESKAYVTISPNTPEAILKVVNICPVGTPLKITEIVLCDENDLQTTMVNRTRWGSNSLYSRNIIFNNTELNNFVTETGIEGVGKFPLSGSQITMQSFKGPLNNGVFSTDNGNNLKYLVTDQNYTQADLQTILSNAISLTSTQTQLSGNSFVDSADFNFVRPTLNHNLYLIWDYRNTAITEDTNILIYFDSSGSMNSTLAPLQTMRDTLLKDALLPFYGYDQDLYDDKVQVLNDGTERTIRMLNMGGQTPQGSAIVLIFQDESSSYNASSTTFDDTATRAQNYDFDLSQFRGRLVNFAPNYYRGVVFQVQGVDGFGQFIQAVQNGTGNYSGANGLSDRSEISYRYNITDGGTPQYYLDQIKDALSDFGINI